MDSTKDSESVEILAKPTSSQSDSVIATIINYNTKSIIFLATLDIS